MKFFRLFLKSHPTITVEKIDLKISPKAVYCGQKRRFWGLGGVSGEKKLRMANWTIQTKIICDLTKEIFENLKVLPFTV